MLLYFNKHVYLIYIPDKKKWRKSKMFCCDVCNHEITEKQVIVTLDLYNECICDECKELFKEETKYVIKGWKF
jgi:hypothetical protein